MTELLIVPMTFQLLTNAPFLHSPEQKGASYSPDSTLPDLIVFFCAMTRCV